MCTFFLQKIGLVIIDEIHLLGEDRGPILEVIVSRMRYISLQLNSPIRVMGLSTALANASDLADWLGIDRVGMYNFRPSVRPIPMEVHIQACIDTMICYALLLDNVPWLAAGLSWQELLPAHGYDEQANIRSNHEPLANKASNRVCVLATPGA